MLVTFKANSRVLNYFPGKIYTEELDPVLKALLEKDVHLQLIDPPSLELSDEMKQSWFTPEVEPKTTKPDFPVKKNAENN
jgi:hypothetical protein